MTALQQEHENNIIVHPRLLINSQWIVAFLFFLSTLLHMYNAPTIAFYPAQCFMVLGGKLEVPGSKGV